MELLWTKREGNGLLAYRKASLPSRDLRNVGRCLLQMLRKEHPFSDPSHRGTSKVLPEGSPASGFREQGGTWLEERGHGVSG